MSTLSIGQVARRAGVGVEAVRFYEREGYLENSPIFYLDRVQTPVLLTCGSLDPGAATQAEAVFAGLRRLEKQVELRRYEGEGHWPGIWSERSYRDLCERVLGWFDEHLKRRDAPA